jgi:hypothetical protein
MHYDTTVQTMGSLPNYNIIITQDAEPEAAIAQGLGFRVQCTEGPESINKLGSTDILPFRQILRTRSKYSTISNI